MVAPDPDRLAFLKDLASTSFPERCPSDHLLQVARSVAMDANGVWAEIWSQFKPYVTPGGLIDPQLSKGFVPECGWGEFMEKLWLLKHYLDSIDRLCRNKP